MQVDLGRKATLVMLSISQWYGKRVDNKGTQTVATALSVNTKDDAYTKRLVPKSALSAITSLVSQARDYHRTNTLSWGDDVRILPAKSFFSYTQQMSLYKSRLENMVEAFLDSYPQLTEEAKIQKGSMFDSSDYPPADKIRESFAINVSFMPFPSAEDFRLEIDAKLQAELIAEARHTYQAKIDRAQASLFGKFAELLAEWEAVLAEDKWRPSLLDRLTLLCEIAPAQNLLDDESVRELVKDCESLAARAASQGQAQLKDVTGVRGLALVAVRELIVKHNLKVGETA